ncbi:MAG TPA: hypothetical protein PLB02_05700 [Thermoanaerobaculia bacterium]|nr:hypothetical protein [Thermoanaerobaculia bacterium]HQR66870.1 hypothetical protein [Thermoanaerobaculia bacterium]
MSASEIRPPAPHGASPDGPVGGATGAFEFLPKDFDWKGSALATVRRYPLPCLLGAAAVGFWLGRTRGRAIAGAAAGALANLAVRQIASAVETGEF